MPLSRGCVGHIVPHPPPAPLALQLPRPLPPHPGRGGGAKGVPLPLRCLHSYFSLRQGGADSWWSWRPKGWAPEARGASGSTSPYKPPPTGHLATPVAACLHVSLPFTGSIVQRPPVGCCRRPAVTPPRFLWPLWPSPPPPPLPPWRRRLELPRNDTRAPLGGNTRYPPPVPRLRLTTSAVGAIGSARGTHSYDVRNVSVSARQRCSHIVYFAARNAPCRSRERACSQHPAGSLDDQQRRDMRASGCRADGRWRLILNCHLDSY